MTDLEEKILALARTHPEPNNKKIERYQPRLQSMLTFYSEKAKDAPQKQAWMFTGFCNAILFSAGTMLMYRRLTRKLQDLAEEIRDGNET